MNTKKCLFIFIAISLVSLVCFIIIELSLMFLYPQPTLYPRFKFSSKYGFELFENTTMKHEMYGKWKYHYKVNNYGYRGKTISVSNTYKTPNIIVLGDSYTFGIGVHEKEEYSAVIDKELKEKYNVINLGTSGYGLAQQIRKYYEFGQLYKPEVVILQFCHNDLDDNINNKVTKIENGRFKFIDSSNPYLFVKKYLSNSIIQKSNTYNLFRNRLYNLITKKHIKKQVKEKTSNSQKIPLKEKFYIELLELFIKDLTEKNIQVIMIAVNNDLNKCPHLKNKVQQLNQNKLFKYVEVSDWFKGKNPKDYGSPEGHYWGTKAHKIIGQKLSKILTTNP